MRTRSPQGLFIPAPRLNQLRMLEQIAGNPGITQAELAKSCALSVAMVNNYMKEMCDQNLLEYRRKNSKTITYHVTPAGTEAAGSIRHELVQEWVNLLSDAREQVTEMIRTQAHKDIKRVVLYGSGLLAEIVFHALEASGVSIIGICSDDPVESRRDLCGRERINPSQVRYLMPDAVIITQPGGHDDLLRSLESLPGHDIEVIWLDGRAPMHLEAPPLHALAHASF